MDKRWLETTISLWLRPIGLTRFAPPSAPFKGCFAPFFFMSRPPLLREGGDFVVPQHNLSKNEAAVSSITLRELLTTQLRLYTARQSISGGDPMRAFVAWTLMFMFVVVSPLGVLAQSPNGNGVTNGVATVKPNYELASRWTQQKVAKLVFDTAVTPNWLETSDRFWYVYETN